MKIKTVLMKGITSGCVLALLYSCNSVPVEQKGWDAYLRDTSNTVGATVNELKEILQKDLTLNYVHLNDKIDEVSVNNVYYKGTYGTLGKPGSTFYFSYNVDKDYTFPCDRDLYNSAYDYVMEYGAGRIGKLSFN